MIKPVKCAECGREPKVWQPFIDNEGYRKSTVWIVDCRECLDFEPDATRLGAILRWNWRQWRARRKSKGEATT